MNAIATKHQIPQCLTGNSGLKLYRGLREESRTTVYSFWAPDPNYAAQYSDSGDIIAAELNANATILDLISVIDADGYVAGNRINDLMSGLAEALGIDGDTEIEADRLWDAAGDDLSDVAELLSENGYEGMRWIENNKDIAYLLIHK